MANHNEYSFPKEYRHYLADLFCKSGIADYTEQIRTLAEVCECSAGHARSIMAGKRDFSGTRTGKGLRIQSKQRSSEKIVKASEHKSKRSHKVYLSADRQNQAQRWHL